MDGPEHNPRRSLVIGVAAIALTLACWSTAPLLIRSFRGVIDAHTNNAVRYGFGTIIWLPLMLSMLRRGELGTSLFRSAIRPVTWNVVGQVFFVMAFYEIDPGLVTFALRSQILTVAILAPFVFPSERATLRSPRFLLGMGMVLTGVLTMAGIAVAHSGELAEAAGRAVDDPWRTARGVTYAVCAGVGYAGYGLGVRKHLAHVDHTKSFVAVGLMTSLAMIAVMLVASPSHGLDVLTMEPADYARLLLAGFIGIGVSHVLYYIAMDKLGVTIATGVIQTQPVFVFSLSHLVYRETFTLTQFGFGMLAIAGAIMMLSAKRSGVPSPADEPVAPEGETAGPPIANTDASQEPDGGRERDTKAEQPKLRV